MKIIEISSEDPIIHWEFVNVEGKRVLDLGCGDFGNYGKFSYMSSLEFFLLKGATSVIGVDQNINDIDKLSNKISSSNYKLMQLSINSPSDVYNIVKNEKIEVLKSDIEGGEKHLFDAKLEDFCLIDEYYIETHGEDLHNNCLEKLKVAGYDVYCLMNLLHTRNPSKVVFARKN